MATGGEVQGQCPDRVGSEDLDKIKCQPCLEDGNLHKAVGMCIDCQENLCSQCFKIHTRPKPWRNHQLLDKDQMLQSHIRTSPKDVCTEECSWHEGEKITERPSTTWGDVVGSEGLVRMLREYVESSLNFPQLFTGPGGRTEPNVIWLYGPPGSGKTYVSMALINSVFDDVTAFSVSSFTTKQAISDMFVRSMFRLAREKSPSIILIDEIDRFFAAGNNQGQNSAFVEEILKHQKNKGIFVIGHTCQPWLLEPRIRRLAEGFTAYLSLPDPVTRARLFQYHLCKSVQNSTDPLKDGEYLVLGSQSEGYTPSDLVCVVRDAMMEPVREVQIATHFKTVSGPSPVDPSIIVDDLLVPCSPDDPDAVEISWTEHPDKLYCRPVTVADVYSKLQFTKPTVTQEEIQKFEELRNEFNCS